MDKIELKRRVLAYAPADWPDFEQFIDDFYRSKIPLSDFAERACIALGGQAEHSWDICAALFCALASIRVVDDILDEDSKGKHHQLGIGRAANLALAFQALGSRVLVSSEVAACDPRLMEAYALALIDTAFGQELDARGVEDEEGYWRQLKAKSPPVFSCAFEMGARVGGADDAMIAKLVWLGQSLGRLIQVSDDLNDALARPAKEDWKRPNSNLALLFARNTPHAERDEFIRLSAQISEGDALKRAQDILMRSGATSYCTLKMLEFAQEIDGILSDLDLPHPTPLLEIVDLCLEPLREMFKASGHESALGKFAHSYVQATASDL